MANVLGLRLCNQQIPLPFVGDGGDSGGDSGAAWAGGWDGLGGNLTMMFGGRPVVGGRRQEQSGWQKARTK